MRPPRCLEILREQRAAPGLYNITDENDQALLDANGRARVFSTIARATPHLRAGDKVVMSQS